ncbi:DUF1146 family protein [Alicyclobacillus fodiniaquatilis]|uniref:DUF1146 family protein n=1 Tax=Alicyclobacillus fodiniaquatilis TaxID=1661150 RepID=A0ABW4JKW6_9BACL
MNESSGATSVILGTDGIVILMFFFAGLMACWWALAALKWDKFLNHPLSPQAQMLRFFLALFGGLISVGVAVLLLAAMQVARSLS